MLIGAGSASFTRGLVADLVLTPDLGPWELGLVDVEAQALETAGAAGSRTCLFRASTGCTSR